MKRPPPRPLPAGHGGSTSTEGSQTSAKRLKTTRAFDGYRIHVLPEKIRVGDIARLERLIEQHGGRVVLQEGADIVATQLFAVERLRPLLTSRIGSRTVVHTDWIEDSAKRGTPLDVADYLRDLGQMSDNAEAPASVSSSRPRSPPPLEKPTRPQEWHHTNFSCERWTPLICANEALVDELRLIRKHRRLNSNSKVDKSDGRTIASIKAWPKPLALPLPALPHLGTKTQAMVKQFLQVGYIDEARRLRGDARFNALDKLSTIYGIGPETARQLYDGSKTGQPCRTVEDLRRQCSDEYGAALKHMADLELKIPRPEVEEIAELVDRHLQVIAPGAIYCIVGGYRRGKPESNDIDIVFTRPDGASMRGVLDKLVTRLQKANLLVHLISLFGGDSRRAEGTGHHHTSHFDPLDKVFGVWRSQANGTTRLRDIHRRVDLIAADKEYYWTAVFGWTGGNQFERDVRLLASRLGFKFDSGGITRRDDAREIFVESEEEIFQLFRMRWIPPEYRNTD